jgi:hypothetical protein
MPESPRLFVLLHHVLADGGHWDLCLDQGDTLATWQLAANPAGLPESASGDGIPARRIQDHRRAYLDYEGPVSGNRGHVTRIDRGTFERLAEGSAGPRIRFTGSVLIGTYEIVPADDPDQPGRLRRVSDDRGEHDTAGNASRPAT